MSLQLIFGGPIMSFKLPFIKSNKKHEGDTEIINVRRHVARVMEGNGRRAKKRGLARIAGQNEGVDVVQQTVRTASNYNINILTLFAFSTENWKRPKPELQVLRKLPKPFLNTYLPELIEKN